MTTSVLNFPPSTLPDLKVYISHAEIPQSYLDPSQPPVKRCPYRQIHSHSFLRSVQICSNHPIVTSTTSRGTSADRQISYSKVIFNLQDLLENEALRKGNYALLSSPLDPVVRLSLCRGILTFIMPQQTYQRSGLTFPTTRLQSGGRKHEKGSAMQKVEVDLRQPSMTRGRKGFDRLMYAAKNVDGLKEPRVCLFVDLDAQQTMSRSTGTKKRKRDTSTSKSQSEASLSANTTLATVTTTSTDTSTNMPTSCTFNQQEQNHVLAKYHPTHVTNRGNESTFQSVLIPPILKPLATLSQHPSSNSTTILDEDMHEIIEYLSMLFLQSPQLTKQEYGKTDSYISQYRLPDHSIPPSASGDTEPSESILHRDSLNDIELPVGTTIQDLHIISYEGLISSDWMVQTVVDLIRQSRTKGNKSSGDWVVIKAVAHNVEPIGGNDGYMIVLHGSEDSANKDKSEQQNGGSEEMSIEQEASLHSDEDMQIDECIADEIWQDQAPGVARTRSNIGGFRRVTCFEFVDSFT